MRDAALPQVAIVFALTKDVASWRWMPTYRLAHSEPSGHPVHVFQWLWFGVLVAAGFSIKLIITNEQGLRKAVEGGPR